MKNLNMWIVLLLGGSCLWAQDGIMLYTHKNFKGRTERIQQDDPDLTDNFDGRERLRSLRIPANCTVTLYEQRGFRGRAINIKGDVADLEHSELGRDGAFSLRIQWDRPERNFPGRREEGVYLYTDIDYRGTSVCVTQDIANLNQTQLGNDRLSSLKLPVGVEVILYEHTGFRGQQERVMYDDNNLTNNYIGNDRVSSLRIVRHVAEAPREDHRGEVIMLYEHPGYQGRELLIRADLANLRGTQLGNDRASSIRVPKGYVVTVYADTNFQGTSETLIGDDSNLLDNWIGDNRIRSIKFAMTHPQREKRGKHKRR